MGPVIEQAVLKSALDYPAHGQTRVSNERRKQGTFVLLSGIRSIRLRHTLQSHKQRLKALEKEVEKNGIIFTEDRVIASEQQRATDAQHL